MDENTVFDKIFIEYPTKYMPFMPLGLWWDTNRGLEEFYEKNNIKKQDKEIKNHMRHITGLARATQAYGEPTARILGVIKESADFWRGNQDNVVDFHNNDLGINYIKQNPKATRQEIMDFAYKKAIEKLNKNKTFPHN